MKSVNECIITFFLQSPWPPLRLRTWLWWVCCRQPWSVRQKDDKTSGLTINIHSTITESKAQWLHLVFTVTLHLASSVLRSSSHIHSAHHIVLFCFFPTLLPSAVSLHRLISVCFVFPPPFCYFISSPPEMNMAAERPPDDPQPIMYVESYPYPLSSNKQEITRAPLSKPSSLGGCMLLRGMCSCVIKSERSQTCQALHKLKLKSEDSPDSNFLLDLNSQRWRPVLVLHHCWVVDFTASSKYMWCKIVR